MAKAFCCSSPGSEGGEEEAGEEEGGEEEGGEEEGGEEEGGEEERRRRSAAFLGSLVVVDA